MTNGVYLIGRLVKDPEIKELESGKKVCNITLAVQRPFKNADGEMLLHRLDLMGISVSTGSACDSKTTQISHVIKAIEVPEEYAKGTIRISMGKDNTENDVNIIVESLTKILN